MLFRTLSRLSRNRELVRGQVNQSKRKGVFPAIATFVVLNALPLSLGFHYFNKRREEANARLSKYYTTGLQNLSFSDAYADILSILTKNAGFLVDNADIHFVPGISVTLGSSVLRNLTGDISKFIVPVEKITDSVHLKYIARSVDKSAHVVIHAVASPALVEKSEVWMDSWENKYISPDNNFQLLSLQAQKIDLIYDKGHIGSDKVTFSLHDGKLVNPGLTITTPAGDQK